MSIDSGFALEMGKLLYEYVYNVESVQSKLDRSLGMHLNAAKEIVKNAVNAEGAEQKLEYLKRARDKYFDALGAEKKGSDRMFLAYYGLAFCNRILGDRANMELNLRNAVEVFHRNVRMEREAVVYIEDRSKFSIGNLILGVTIVGRGRDIQLMRKENQLMKIRKGIGIMQPFMEIVRRDYPQLISNG